MRTIQLQPHKVWGAESQPQAPGRYRPTRPQGKRVVGWEDTNIKRLALDVDISFHYLLGVLTGQRNCTLALLAHVSHALGLDLPTLVTRIQTAYRLRSAA